MLSVIAITLLVGLALPIALVVGALVTDAVVMGWLFVRLWHDDWSHKLHDMAAERLLRPVQYMSHWGHHGHHVARR